MFKNKWYELWVGCVRTCYLWLTVSHGQSCTLCGPIYNFFVFVSISGSQISRQCRQLPRKTYFTKSVFKELKIDNDVMEYMGMLLRQALLQSETTV